MGERTADIYECPIGCSFFFVCVSLGDGEMGNVRVR